MVMNVTQPGGDGVPAEGSLGIVLQRRSGRNWLSQPAWAEVKPGEPVRYQITGSVWLRAGRIHVESNLTGVTVFGPVGVIMNLAGNGSVETVAPLDINSYTLFGDEDLPFRPDNHAQTFFVVTPNAPDPPEPPLPDKNETLEGIKGILIAGAVVVGLIAVAPAIKRVSEIGKR